MRAYFFGNMYLSSLQQGLQAAHVIAEMFVKYQYTSCSRILTLTEWASLHKTIILLNAGYSSEIHALDVFFSNEDNPYPWAKFNEGEDALDGALTDIGIILPERIYLLSSICRHPNFSFKSVKNGLWVPRLSPAPINEFSKETLAIIDDINAGYQPPLSTWEVDLIKRLTTYGLAK